MARKISITVEPEGRILQCAPNSSLLGAFREAGVQIRAECGGQGSCGQCRVLIQTKTSIDKPTNQEHRLLTDAEILKGVRLACQTTVRKSIKVMLPIESRISLRQIQTEGLQITPEIDSTITKLLVQTSKPTLHDLRSDRSRLLDSLRDSYNLRKLNLSYEAVKKLPPLIRRTRGDLTATLWNNHRVIDLEAGDTTETAFGYAVDIGTSKIVGQLISLTTGQIVTTHSLENPQMIHGEDVISRITYAASHETGLQELRDLVTDAISSLLSAACQEADIQSSHIYEMTWVGNSAMHHILLNIPPLTLAVAPYTPAIKKPLDLSPKELGIHINKGGNVHSLPLIAGFVGSDNVADILSTQFNELQELSLLIDIGTNTEVNLGNREGIICCSCASGPAFEGAHIRDGMKAVAGAIERVTIDPSTFEVHSQVIGNQPPVGLCGSAMIDVLAELVRNKIVDHTGRISPQHSQDRIRRRNESLEFVIAWDHETAKNGDIVITQGDIRELQLAKAAIYTGCTMLLRHRKISSNDIQRVYLAGAFGNYIQPENAIQIGLLLDINPKKVTLVGNAALSGARITLLSQKGRDKAQQIAEQASYIELGAEPAFNKALIAATYLPHQDHSLFPSIAS
jgi:uncharacterized 2Fe-2S/4Fe-4S cluster protein (DUF4445 family)